MFFSCDLLLLDERCWLSSFEALSTPAVPFYASTFPASIFAGPHWTRMACLATLGTNLVIKMSMMSIMVVQDPQEEPTLVSFEAGYTLRPRYPCVTAFLGPQLILLQSLDAS